MNIQDQLERILRELHIMVSRGAVSELDGDYVLVHKKEMQRLLNKISEAVTEMMDQYEVTQESRNQAELEAEKRRMEIIRNANHEAQDIYAASVIYSEDALGRLQDIIDNAEQASKEILNRLGRAMEEEKRVIRSNQHELISQLEDMHDTAKYIRLIEERNREIAKAKAQKKEEKKQRGYQRKEGKASEPLTTAPSASAPEIKINEEYFEKAGLTPDGLPKEEEQDAAEDKVVYEKPVIKVNKEYFERASVQSREKKKTGKDVKEKKTKEGPFFPFGRKA